MRPSREKALCSMAVNSRSESSADKGRNVMACIHQPLNKEQVPPGNRPASRSAVTEDGNRIKSRPI